MLKVLNALSNRNVFNLGLKTDRDDASLIEMGKSFQSQGQLQKKNWHPYISTLTWELARVSDLKTWVIIKITF